MSVSVKRSTSITRASVLSLLYGAGIKTGRRITIVHKIVHGRLDTQRFAVLDGSDDVVDIRRVGLDPHGIIDIRKLILNLSRDMGITIILSSHILKEVEIIAF